jgi:N-acetylglutamate synthase-like GNAT family acetyltransferase
VTDDLTAMRLQSLMGNEFRLVFPMNTLDEIQSPNSIRKDLPGYYLALATRREDHDLLWLLAEILPQLLSTEVESTAVEWEKLARMVFKEVFGAFKTAPPLGIGDDLPSLWAAAWRWTRYALTLSSKEIDAYFDPGLPWKPILVRARQILQSYFAHDAQKHLISAQVERIFPSTEGNKPRFTSSDDLRRLSNLFDVELPPGYQDARRYTGKPEHLTAVVRALLRGEQPRVDVEVGPYDAAKRENAAAVDDMRRMMRELEGMYLEKRAEAPGAPDRIQNDLKSLTTRCGGDSGSVVLANLVGQPNTFVGGLCLLKEQQGKRYQIRYLWVDQDYRRSKVGSQLIENAINFAKEKGAQSIYVEIIPVLRDAIAAFRANGFRRMTNEEQKPDMEMRIVYKLEFEGLRALPQKN